MVTTVHARRFDTDAAVEIQITGDRISAIHPWSCSENEAAALPIASPGFFDIQINGYQGIWFASSELTILEVSRITEALLQRGITRYFPTLITASFEALRHGFETLKKACEADEMTAATVAGYHLEGPYISSEDGPRGAHPRQHVRPADYEEFQKLQQAAGNRIRLVTLAAEAENAVPFIQQCCRDGVVVSLGHTGATPEQIHAAINAGAKLSTHFGNGAHGTLPRHPNYLWEQLADDRLWASVISDGWHVPPSVLQCVVKCKTLKHTILTCDVSGYAGCPVGTYGDGNLAVDVLDDGRIVVAGQTQFLAGSGATTGDCVAHMMDACHLPLSDCVAMATTNPGQLFHEQLPELSPGQEATFSTFYLRAEESNGHSKHRFLPAGTWLKGRQVSAP
ncbi:MAG: amidohydrolase family protein [Planctomycetaceae bacterium]|nr:amidohydrolase family protein [Planctomycetaceae bacterium]